MMPWLFCSDIYFSFRQAPSVAPLAEPQLASLLFPFADYKKVIKSLPCLLNFAVKSYHAFAGSRQKLLL